MGAHRVIDDTSEDFVEVITKETGGTEVDVVFDIVGGELITQSGSVSLAKGGKKGEKAEKRALKGALWYSTTVALVS